MSHKSLHKEIKTVSTTNWHLPSTSMSFPGGSVIKNLPARQELQETQVQSPGRKNDYYDNYFGVSVQFSCLVMSNSLGPHVHHASLSITNSRSLLKLMSIKPVMPLSNHLIFCHPLLLSPSVFPSIRVFSNESGFWCLDSAISEVSPPLYFSVLWFNKILFPFIWFELVFCQLLEKKFLFKI